MKRVAGALEQLSDDEDATQRLIVQIAALYRWTDRMVAARNEAGVKAIEKAENLTRTQLREKQQEILKQARQGVADRLKAAAAKHDKPLVGLADDRTAVSGPADRPRFGED